jgi:hypothetical protein
MTSGADLYNGENGSDIPSESSWREYRRLILSELKRLSNGVDTNSDRLSSIEARLKALETRAAIFGAIAGAVPGLFYLLYQMAQRKP